jgi:hypothetical protein
MIATYVEYNKMNLLKVRNVELFVKNLTFLGDFSSVVNLLVITDMLVAVKTGSSCEIQLHT